MQNGGSGAHDKTPRALGGVVVQRLVTSRGCPSPDIACRNALIYLMNAAELFLPGL